jgi:hypothetical protein
MLAVDGFIVVTRLTSAVVGLGCQFRETYLFKTSQSSLECKSAKLEMQWRTTARPEQGFSIAENMKVHL